MVNILSIINSIIFAFYTYSVGNLFLKEKNKISYIISAYILFLVMYLITIYCLDSLYANLIGAAISVIFLRIVFKDYMYDILFCSMIVHSFRLSFKLLSLFFLERNVESILSYGTYSIEQFGLNIVTCIIAFIFIFSHRFMIRSVLKKFVNCKYRCLLFYTYFIINLVIVSFFRKNYLSNGIELFIEFVILLFILSLSFFIFKDDDYIYKLRRHYNELKEYTDNYFSLLTEYKMSLHDNKNHLLAIKSMTNDKKVQRYVDSILESISINDTYFEQLNNIPNAGIRAFLNIKLQTLKKMGAIIELSVSSELYDVTSECADNLYTIIGIFMDNMIEYLDNYDEKLVSIQIYTVDNILHGEYVNSYYGDNNINIFYKIGYSTKNDHSGVGIPIVKKIVDNSNYLNWEMKVVDNFFVQHIMVDLEKLGVIEKK